jgi:hypothetical protein
VRRQFDFAFFEKLKIMLPACAESGGKNSPFIHIRKYLRIMGITFLFSAVLMPLFLMEFNRLLSRIDKNNF